MTVEERFAHILNWFTLNKPNPEPELSYDSPFGLTVAVILSAQCTDKRVNMVTPALLRAFPDPSSMASAELGEVLPYVKSVSYPNSKTRHLIEMSRALVERFGGEVPRGIEELMSLPGVGRKTANVVSSVLWDRPVIAVDTHVFRVAHRLGLSKGKTPEAVERDLEAHVPEGLRSRAHHWFLLHGRYVCTARSPKCGDCRLSPWCEHFANAGEAAGNGQDSHARRKVNARDLNGNG